VRVICVGDLAASLVTETLPLTDPVVVGAKVTVKVVLCPAVKLNGVVSPLVVKPTPVTISCEILTLELPGLVRVTDLLLLLPMFTFP
jgi:hypothetical protein